MAASVNVVFLVGNLGADPEVRYTDKGKAVCNIRIATNEGYKDASGQWQEKTEWHRIVIWGPQGEATGEYKKKGHSVHVQGKLQTREWEDKNGVTRYTTEVVADKVTFLGGNGKDKQSDHRASTSRSSDVPPF